MFSTYIGTFWSATTRALLSLRRDKGLSTQEEDEILSALPQIETGDYPITKLDHLLKVLAFSDTTDPIGQSLLGYLDFNKMGTIHCYLSMAKNIQAALAALKTYKSPLFDPSEEISIDNTSEQITVSLKMQSLEHMELFASAFLLALFRHLAGRDFDFQTVERRYADIPWLLNPVSGANERAGQKLSMTFNSAWLTRQSYFYSPKLQIILEKNLQLNSENRFKQSLLSAFHDFPHPARIRADLIATALNMSESAFRRKLRQESLSFSSLLKSHIHEQSISELLSGTKVDVIADKLGFSDRRAFDRSFKEFTGVSPGQLRQVSSRLRFQRGNQALIEITENLPPLPETIGHIIGLQDEQLTVSKLVKLITPDPVFRAHIMGKASRALFGSVPDSLEQAIGRNIGVNNVKNLAVLFAAQQYLTHQSVFPNLAQLTDAMLLGHTLFDRLFADDYSAEDKSLISQLVLFGPLALLLIFHSEHLDAAPLYEQWQKAEDFEAFTNTLTNEFHLCLYGASSLLLLRWGLSSKVNEALWRLCQDTESKMGNRIKACHQLAFNHLCFDKATNAESLQTAGFSQEQQDTANQLLHTW